LCQETPTQYPKSVAISTNKEGTTNNKIEKEKNRGRSISAAILCEFSLCMIPRNL
jgi:hypothetical protein